MPLRPVLTARPIIPQRERKLQRYPHTIRGRTPQQQRVAPRLARAFIGKPPPVVEVPRDRNAPVRLEDDLKRPASELDRRSVRQGARRAIGAAHGVRRLVAFEGNGVGGVGLGVGLGGGLGRGLGAGLAGGEEERGGREEGEQWGHAAS